MSSFMNLNPFILIFQFSNAGFTRSILIWAMFNTIHVRIENETLIAQARPFFINKSTLNSPVVTN